MPSLDQLMKDMLVVVGATPNPQNLTEMDVGMQDFASRPNPNSAGPTAQPIWVWSYSGLRELNGEMPMNKATSVEVWSRSMAAMHGQDYMGWMTAANEIEWGPVHIVLPTERLLLPLIQRYFVKGYFLSAGTNSGTTNPMWPISGNLDQSFVAAFAYDLSVRLPNGQPTPVSPERFNRNDFMPPPGQESGTIPPGSTTSASDPSQDHHFVLVCISLACFSEAADFEPGGLIGMGRIIPHLMIMSNKRLDVSLGADQHELSLQAEVTVRRPPQAGYYGLFMTGGVPRIMNHPDMAPGIAPLLVTDTNVFRGADGFQLVQLPYWDLIFDYTMTPLSGAWPGTLPMGASTDVVVRGLGPRQLTNAWSRPDHSHYGSNPIIAGTLGTLLAAFPGAAPLANSFLQMGRSRPSARLARMLPFGNPVKADFLPLQRVTVQKVARQGSFDSVHMAPRMVANQLLADPFYGSDPNWRGTMELIPMAPFCDHDCFHTHWRWGSFFSDPRAAAAVTNKRQVSGFAASSDPRFAGIGEPYKTIGSPMIPLNQTLSISFPKFSHLKYAVDVHPAAPGVWQPVYHHGSAYALGYTAAATAILVGIKGLAAGSQESSEFYWNLQFQAAADGPTPRMTMTDIELVNLIGL